MRLRQIEVFYAVYSAGSISKAGELLGVSQPAISKVIRHTEDLLGYKLFDRTASGIVPTQEAIELFESAARVFAEVNKLRGRANNMLGGLDKPLRIALSPSIGLSAGPTAVAQFAAKFPDISVEIETFHFEEAVDALRAEQTDIAIVYQPFPREGLRVIPIRDAKFVCVTPKGHWLNRGGKVGIKDLIGEPLIHLNVDAPLGRLLSSYLENVSEIQQSQRITVNTYYIARMLVASGAGLAVVDEFAARDPGRDSVDIYEFDEKVELSIGAIVRESYALSGPEHVFLEALNKELERASKLGG